MPALNIELPINNSWLRLKVQSDANQIINTKKSLENQILSYMKHGERQVDNFERRSTQSDYILKTHDHSVIIGGPGAGKSTMLRRFAWEFSDNNLVVNVSLPNVLRHTIKFGATFEQALIKVGFDGSAVKPEDATKLLNSATILLCDGLDECDPHRVYIAENIVRWKTAHQNCSICVTTRAIGHTASLLPDFQHFTILAPEVTQIEHHSKVLFEEFNRKHEIEQFEAKKSYFLEKINSKNHNSYAKNIAQLNPLLVGFLVRLSIDNMEIPDKKTDIYAGIISTIAITQPNDRASTDFSAKIALEVLYSLAWQNISDPFMSYEEKTSIVSKYIQTRFQQDELKSDELVSQGIEFWEDRRLLETIQVGTDKHYFFIHLSFQEFAAANFAIDLSDQEFEKWIKKAVLKDKWRQVILHLSCLEVEQRTMGYLVDSSDTENPLSYHNTIAVETILEKSDTNSPIPIELIDSLKTGLISTNPLLCIEAARDLAKLIPYVNSNHFITKTTNPTSPWHDLAQFQLEVLSQDSNELVEKFKDWFKNYSPIDTSLGKLFPRNDQSELPEEARGIQIRIIERGINLMFEKCSTKDLNDYFTNNWDQSGKSAHELGIVSRKLNEKGLNDLSDKITGSLRLPNIKDFLSKPDVNDKRLRNFVRMIADSCETSDKKTTPNSFLSLFSLISYFNVLEIPINHLIIFDRLTSSNDPIGSEIIRTTATALKLNIGQIGVEANELLKHDGSIVKKIDHIEPKSMDSDLSDIEVNVDLISKGILHEFPPFCKSAAVLIASGVGGKEAARELPHGLESKYSYVVFLASNCIEMFYGDKSFNLFQDRLNSTETPRSIDLFEKLVELSGDDDNVDVLACLFKWIGSDDLAGATLASSQLAALSPRLDHSHSKVLEEMFAHWTEKKSLFGSEDRIIIENVNEYSSTAVNRIRSNLLVELIRLEVYVEYDLYEFIEDKRSSVSDVVLDTLSQQASKDEKAFDTFVENINVGKISAITIEDILRKPIKPGSIIAKKVVSLLSSCKPELKVPIIRQLTGKWIEPDNAQQILNDLLADNEPYIRTLAVRTMRQLHLAGNEID